VDDQRGGSLVCWLWPASCAAWLEKWRGGWGLLIQHDGSWSVSPTLAGAAQLQASGNPAACIIVLPGENIENTLQDIQYFPLSASRFYALSGLKLFIYVLRIYLWVTDIYLYFAEIYHSCLMSYVLCLVFYVLCLMSSVLVLYHSNHAWRQGSTL
jgi:hypothetical protein